MVMRTVHSNKVAQHPSTGDALTRQNYRELLARIEAQKEIYRQSDEPLQPEEKTNV